MFLYDYVIVQGIVRKVHLQTPVNSFIIGPQWNTRNSVRNIADVVKQFLLTLGIRKNI